MNRNNGIEYAKLVGRQHRSGKVVLSDWAHAGGAIFPVGKPSGAQREVWNGTRVSQAAARPPKPVHLLSPTSLLTLEVRPGDHILVCKRDARCYFDQLRLPEALRPWVGRPKLSVDMLLKHAGFTREDLATHLVGGICLDGLSHVMPLCATFPMGFLLIFLRCPVLLTGTVFCCRTSP